MRSRSPATTRRWISNFVSVVLFALLCGVATYWALQLFAPRVAIAPAGSLVDWQKAPDLQAASRLFGAPPSSDGTGPTAAAPSNIKVLGVAASSQRATAVLSIDGKPPVAFLAGAKISDSARLLEVHADSVVIEQAGGRIKLPAPTRPDVKVLSAGANRAATSSLASPVGTTPVPAAARQPTRRAPEPMQPAPEPMQPAPEPMQPAPEPMQPGEEPMQPPAESMQMQPPAEPMLPAEEPPQPVEPGEPPQPVEPSEGVRQGAPQEPGPGVDPDRPVEPGQQGRYVDPDRPIEG